MTDLENVISKIKKCLALGASSNEHEAEAALRQARKLMEAYGLSESDIHASEAGERRSKSGAGRRPARWETLLANKVADVFGCRVLFVYRNVLGQRGEWCFIGCGIGPEIAQYAFAVLIRQAKKAREQHMKTVLKRCKQSIKTRRADLFSDAWVHAVVSKIVDFAGTETQTIAIAAYTAKHYPTLVNFEPQNRNDGRKLREHDYADLVAGSLSGSNARLERGIGGQSPIGIK